MTIEEIKKQIEELTKAVNELPQPGEDSFTFTREQLVSFTNELVGRIKNEVRSEVNSITFDENIVSLSIDYNNTIEVDVDSGSITDEVVGAVDSVDLSEDEIVEAAEFILSR